jgi:hypothetical protein
MFAYTGANEIGQNFYYHTSYKYATTGVASALVQSGGVFYFRNTASGSANTALTWTNAMTLTASGRLLIGTPTEATYMLDVNGTGRFSGALSGTSAVFSSSVRVNGAYSYGSFSVLGTQGLSWSSVGNDIAFGLATIGTATTGASLWVHTPAPLGGWTSGLGIDGTTDNANLSTIQLTAYGLKFSGYNSKLVLRTTNGTTITNALILDGANSGAATFSSTLGINGTSDNIKSGTYTPTLTNYYNISSSSFDAYTSTKYVRIGNNVTVTGLVNITPTTAASYVILYLSLPIASTNTDQGTLVGSTETDEVVFGGVLQTSSVCILQFNNVTNNSRYVYYTFTYIIS